MKKFILVFNIVLFLFVSYVIFQEFLQSNGSLFPSVLYERAEKLGNISKYYRNPLWNIIFTYISVVILIALIFIILLFLRKVKNYFYILSTISNLIIAIPIFYMYNNLFCPFDNNLNYIISPWMCYIFFSVISAILLSIHILKK